MVRIGTPQNISAYYCVDEGWLIAEIHKAGIAPEWKDSEAVYFKKSNKLKKVLKKLDIEID